MTENIKFIFKSRENEYIWNGALKFIFKIVIENCVCTSYVRKAA